MRRLIALSLLAWTAPMAAMAADAARGARLYHDDGCFQCHGTNGQGGAAPTLAPPATPSAERIAAYIRKPTGEMPPYNARVLDDAAVADIRAYLGTLATAPDPASLDQLKWAQGGGR